MVPRRLVRFCSSGGIWFRHSRAEPDAVAMARTKQSARRSNKRAPRLLVEDDGLNKAEGVDEMRLAYEAALREADRIYQDVEMPAEVARKVATTFLHRLPSLIFRA